MTLDRSSRPDGIAAPLLLLGFALFWFSDTIADPDLWGHVRFGRDILRDGAIVQIDAYSYRTAGQPWFNHEWLSEVIFAAVHGALGSRGLIALKLLIALTIAGVCYVHLRRRGLEAAPASALLILASIPFRMGLGTVRPQVFTYLLFLAELMLIEGAGRGRGWGIWLAPILLSAWVNLHGGVLAGAGVLGLWIAVRGVERLRRDGTPWMRCASGLAPLVLLAMAGGLALWLNPRGGAMVTFLLRTATVPRPEIGEWAPIGLTSLPGLIFLGLLGVGIVALWSSRRRRDPAAVAIFAATAALPMVASRHYPLFVIAMVVLLGEHLADAWDRARPHCPTSGRARRAAVPVAMIAALGMMALSVPRLACIRVEPFYFNVPARAVELLKRSGFRGNLAVPFDWGEYVIWQLGPGVKVSVDGRRETAYSEASYRQARDLERGTGAWDASLESPAPADLVLAPTGSPTLNLMAQSSGWLALYQDRCCALFARRGLATIPRIVATPVPAFPDDGDGTCFPASDR